MPSRVKTPLSQAGPYNQNGQALIEYILMLVISVSLVLLLATQIFTPLQSFLKAYMGDYVQCLLEVGELPSLGGEDTMASDEGCNAKFEAASISDGRPPKSDSSSGSNGGSDSSSGSNGESSKSSSSKSEGSSSDGGTNAGSASRTGGRAVMLPRNGPTGIDGSSSSSSKVTEIPVEQQGAAGSGFFVTGNNQVIYVRRPAKTTSIGITGLTDEEKKKLEKRNIASKVQNIAADSGTGSEPKKLIVKPPEPKKQIEKEDSGWSIGNFIRYIFIACIIIVLLIFIGGQALQMSKSMEK